jgi:hypothetical protein
MCQYQLAPVISIWRKLAEELDRLRGVQLGHVADRPKLGVQEAFGHGCRVADASGLEGARQRLPMLICLSGRQEHE